MENCEVPFKGYSKFHSLSNLNFQTKLPWILKFQWWKLFDITKHGN